ncbi:MAG: DUF3179 domain-containing protein [Anaerolineales bacterium]|nr:DUF3179 domain-containing protein [Anaerolineales bacterium]
MRYLVLVLVLGMLLMPTFNTHAAPNSQQIDCADGPIPVSASLQAQWPNTDFCQHQYAYTDIISGGPPRDGITPIYPEGYVYPNNIYRLGGQAADYTVSYQSIEEGNQLLFDQSPVIVVVVHDDAQAVPLGVLTSHEIANTTVGGVPIAITFCPLCNAGIAFERMLNGQELHFGVSGFLRLSDMVMWDHETESWWQQATGEGIVGVMTGQQLQYVTSIMVSWGDFKAAYPDGRLLIPTQNGTIERDYDRNPYVGYDQTEQPFLFRGIPDERLSATERVLGYIVGSGDSAVSIAYPFSALEQEVVINDTVEEQAVVVFWQPGATSALGASRISAAEEVGSAALFDRTLEDGTVLTFVAEDTRIMDEQTGSTWNIFGQAVEGPLKGTALVQLRSVSHFWFAWAAFYSETTIWGQE